MANGKGSLECCYCTYWQGQYNGYDGAYEEGHCLRFNAPLPSTLSTWEHRVCASFSPGPEYERDSSISVEERFSWFGKPLEPGVLYVFPYNDPPSIRKLVVLLSDGDSLAHE